MVGRVRASSRRRLTAARADRRRHQPLPATVSDRAPRRRPATCSASTTRPGGVTPVDPTTSARLPPRADVTVGSADGRSDTYTGLALHQRPPAVGLPGAARRDTGRRPGLVWLRPGSTAARAAARAGPVAPTAGSSRRRCSPWPTRTTSRGGTDGNDGDRPRAGRPAGRGAGRRRPVEAADRAGRAGRDRRHRDRRHAGHRSGSTTGRAEDRRRRPDRALRAAALPDRHRRPAARTARSPASASSGRSSTPSTPRSTTRGWRSSTRRAARPRRGAGDPAAAAVRIRRRHLRAQRHRARRAQGAGQRGGARASPGSCRTSPSTGRRCSTRRASTRCASSRAAATGSGAPAR